MKTSSYTQVKTVLAVILLEVTFFTGGALLSVGFLSGKQLTEPFIHAATQSFVEAEDAAQQIANTTPIKPSVIFTEPGDKRNCGAESFTYPDGSPGEGGCWRSETPTNIYVSKGLEGATLKYVILHESAHAYQHATLQKLDECQADEIAIAWGAGSEQAFYVQDGECQADK